MVRSGWLQPNVFMWWRALIRRARRMSTRYPEAGAGTARYSVSLLSRRPLNVKVGHGSEPLWSRDSGRAAARFSISNYYCLMPSPSLKLNMPRQSCYFRPATIEQGKKTLSDMMLVRLLFIFLIFTIALKTLSNIPCLTLRCFLLQHL